MSLPNPQDPDSPLYDFIDTQPTDVYPVDPPAGDSLLSHFTTRQFIPEDITATLPIIVTKTNHGLQNGQALRATKFISIPFSLATGMEQLNNNLFYVRQVTSNTFQLCNYNTNSIDGRNFTAYIQGGQFTLTGPDVLIVNPSLFPPPGIPIEV